MFHIMIRGEIGLANVPSPVNHQYYYGAFQDLETAFRTCADDPLVLETINFGDWLGEYLGEEEKIEYEEYLAQYEANLSHALQEGKFNSSSFGLLEFNSPVELYERSVVFASNYSNYKEIVDNLLEEEDFESWLQDHNEWDEDSYDDNDRLSSYLLKLSENDFSNMVEAFVEYRQNEM